MKKIITILAAFLFATATFAQTKENTVQVVMPESVNLSGNEASWLPGQLQDKIKSNLQEYLGMKTVVDSKSEVTLKKLQREAESGGRDENTAIELGKISTAQFAVMTKIRKTGKGYTVSVDYTDMTTGVQKATATSKEYAGTDELYGNTGAIDEITLILSEKLGIAINPIQKQALRYGTADFSIDDQLKLAKQNEEQYKKLMGQFDEQIQALSVSNDLNAVENKKKIEAEKALLAEKQRSEQNRLAELAEQKKKADDDARLEAERSDEQKKKRDALSAEAAKKAAEVRKLKMAKQGVFGQINVIESKKKALVEIREGVENRTQELYGQLVKDKKAEEDKIRDKTWASIELENGKPTQAAQRRRENQVNESNESLTVKFISDAESVKSATIKQDSDLLAEIRADQKAIEKPRTVNSMGSELKVSYGSYSGENKGWNVYLSLYTDGIELTNLDMLLTYKAVTGKDAPNLETADDKSVQDYMDTVDMYNSLLLRGDPIFYYEIDYTVTALYDSKPSAYEFKLREVRTISTVKNTVLQKNPMAVTVARTMTPQWDIREKGGILAKVKQEHEIKSAGGSDSQISYYNTLGIVKANESIGIIKKQFQPMTYLAACNYCNKLSEECGLEPVYEITDRATFKKNCMRIVLLPATLSGALLFASRGGIKFFGAIVLLGKTPTRIIRKKNVNGFRLPTETEWKEFIQNSCEIENRWYDELIDGTYYSDPFYDYFDERMKYEKITYTVLNHFGVKEKRKEKIGFGYSSQQSEYPFHIVRNLK